MRDPRNDPRENGIALVMAILVLLVLAVMAMILMMNVTMNRQVAGTDRRGTQALTVAEAGLGEAMARLRNGDITLLTTNPRAVAQVFLTSAGSVPVTGADTTAIETSQPAGAWLRYSTPSKGPDVLTVQFKTNSARTQIYYYDASLPNPINMTSGLPIYVITSTGQQGASRRRVVAEVIQKPYVAAAKAALTGDQDIRFIGNAVVCGYNHTADTPTHAGESGRYGGNSCMPYETGQGNLPGSWTTGSTQNGGAATQDGYPDKNVSGGVGFYPGPWAVLGMSQAEFMSWIGPALPGTSNIYGIVHLDNDGVAQNQSGSFAFHSATGEGLLYADGDLTINAGFVYRGLIYVEGDLKMNGQAWILGGLIVRGRSEIRQNGGATILYSSDAIGRALARYGGQFVTLAWREVPL